MLQAAEDKMMFERFTKASRKVVFFARYEASRNGAAAIEPFHILLALERQEKQVTASFVQEHPEIERLRQHVSPKGVPWWRLSTSVKMPLSGPSKQVIVDAIAAADAAGRKEIEAADLLGGLLKLAVGGGEADTGIRH